MGIVRLQIVIDIRIGSGLFGGIVVEDKLVVLIYPKPIVTECSGTVSRFRLLGPVTGGRDLSSVAFTCRWALTPYLDSQLLALGTCRAFRGLRSLRPSANFTLEIKHYSR